MEETDESQLFKRIEYGQCVSIIEMKKEGKDGRMKRKKMGGKE